MRRIRSILLALAFAALGTAAGRFIAESRRRAEAGEPFEPSLDSVAMPGVRELLPGLVAALRVHDRPWSYLHIPGWLAAFAVNLIVAAFGRELPFLSALGITVAEAAPDIEYAPPPTPPPPPFTPPATEVWTTGSPPAPSSPPPPGFRPFPG